MSPVHEVEAVRAPAAVPGHILPPGTRLREYELKALIGESPCSVVYLGWDHALQRKVAVKEYMPAAMAGRLQGSTSVVVGAERHLEAVKAGMRAFLNEARVLARFDHPALVKIYRFWEENGTAYVVMPYYEGPTLGATLAELGHVPSEHEIRAWLKPILNGVTLLHDGGVWHQNIGPDEILMTPFGPVLLGFSAAAHAIEAMRHTPAAALKPGYAAIEQYGSAAGTTRGPWTDLYALGAVVHAAITGIDPPPSADRLTDDRMRPLSVVAAGLYSERFLAAVDAAMAVQPRRRPSEHAEFRALMGDIEAPEAVSLAPAADLMQEPFVGTPARSNEVTVPDPPPTAAAAPMQPPSPALPPRPAAGPAPAAAASGEASPSWMQSAHGRGIGKRALYGFIAGTCALIGIAALVLQFATRPPPRGPAAASAAARTAPATTSTAPTPRPPATTTATAPTPRTPATATATAPTPRTPATATATAPTSRAPAATTPAAVTAAPTRPASTSAHTNTPAPAGATAPTAAQPITAAARTEPVASATAHAPRPAPVPRPASAAAANAPIVASTPLERQARCTEILQKASLEKITPAETDFFRRECK